MNIADMKDENIDKCIQQHIRKIIDQESKIMEIFLEAFVAAHCYKDSACKEEHINAFVELFKDGRVVLQKKEGKKQFEWEYSIKIKDPIPSNQTR